MSTSNLEQQDEKDMKVAIRYGLITAGMIAAFRLGSYFYDPAFLFSFWSFLITPFYMLMMVLAVIAKRKSMGGVISFGIAFRTAIATYFIATVIGVFFMYLLVNHIDPELIIAFKNESIKNSETGMQMMGRPANEIADNQAKAAETDFSQAFSLVAMAKSIVVYSVFAAIYAVFLGGIFQRTPKPY